MRYYVIIFIEKTIHALIFDNNNKRGPLNRKIRRKKKIRFLFVFVTKKRVKS
jgi:hypothetical protein